MRTNGKIQEISRSELKKLNGGVIILAALGVAVAWSAIGATVCWNMAKDNRK